MGAHLLEPSRQLAVASRFFHVEVDERIELGDEQVLAVLDKMVKQRRESLQQYEDAGREDLAEKERFELRLIQTYLPEPLGEEELAVLIRSTIAEVGAMNANLARILGVELLCGAQGIEHRAPLTTGARLVSLIARLRRDVARLEEDRYLAPERISSAAASRSGAVLDAAGPDLFPSLEAVP